MESNWRCTRGAQRVRRGGYAALMTTPVGYRGVLVPADMDFACQAALPSCWTGLVAGLGRGGRQEHRDEIS